MEETGGAHRRDHLRNLFGGQRPQDEPSPHYWLELGGQPVAWIA